MLLWIIEIINLLAIWKHTSEVLCPYCFKTIEVFYCAWFRYSEGVSTPHRHVRTRLYFTSESHIHSLLTIFRYGGLLDVSITIFINIFPLDIRGVTSRASTR